MTKTKQFSQQSSSNTLSHSDTIVISKLKMIAILSGLFMGIQILGGLLANSIAILADAFHLLSDILAYSISLWAVIMSNKNAPKNLSFGYEKSQPLGALVNVAIIWVVTAFLFIEATNRIWHKQIVQEPFYMLLTSIFGLGCNLYIMRILHSDQNHGHGCSHSHSLKHKQLGQTQQNTQTNNNFDYLCQSNSDHKIQDSEQIVQSIMESEENKSKLPSEQKIDKKTHNHKQQDIFAEIQISLDKSEEGKCQHHHDHDHDHHNHNHNHHDHDHHDHDHQESHSLSHNINIQAAYIHIISDIILSIGVILSATIIYFFAQKDRWNIWQLADPFCTYIFSIVAIYSTFQITKKSCILLLDGCQNENLIPEIQTQLGKLKQIEQIANLKIWNGKKQNYHGFVKIICKSDNLQIQKRLQSSCSKIFKSYRIDGAVQIINSKEKLA